MNVFNEVTDPFGADLGPISHKLKEEGPAGLEKSGLKED